ncbi:hypothetical protein VQ042_17630 [Aurantimonas sp. A2-1-M11]|uniref:hypothetical protein n=1 Tax=Aurantimonas sp. A2-1-M11 TaxID=3113712 RepID=UPI002F93AC55
MFFFFQDPDLSALQTPEMKAFTAALDEVRRQYPAMPVGMLYTLLTAANVSSSDEMRGVDLRDLSQTLALPYSTVARHSDALGHGVAKRGGLGLIEKDVIPGQKKHKALKISPAGKALLSAIHLAMRVEMRNPAH